MPAVPTSALTAYQALFIQGTSDAAALQSDADAKAKISYLRVLITTAAGGVASWAVQLARVAGAGAVVTVCGVCAGSRQRWAIAAAQLNEGGSLISICSICGLKESGR
ncbi:uncharacterized protein BCR38DRAFT_410394 [Pseudomassariella vexata]|uniref:Uncharacterized protein n=1 Tax=Pseudomassariella vexata TaxID=1141098 RepID=A0A1Y2DW38_9PEZI|nr:uncharacterized protein BCR38DRAFT_410394 [Pseudomassariella vexata]ORY63478.1 hypothetical protein BCR38DRAFT_410394 [Pseudomassariella vexata]